MEPSIPVLADRVLRQQEKALGTFLVDASARVESPADASPARADLDFIRAEDADSGLEGLRAWTHRACVLTLHAAYEHARGLRAVLAAAEPLPIPAMALDRSIYEAVVQVCWLLDADSTTDQRLARWAGRLLHDSQETPAVLAKIPGGVVTAGQASDASEGQELGKQLMDRAGFSLKEKGGDRGHETANVTFRGAKSNLVPNVESLLTHFMPGDEHLWSILSGAAHCRGWFVAGLEGDEALLVASALAPLLSASDAVVVEVGRYLGLPIRPTLERTHLHRQALLDRTKPPGGPKLGVDLYRASIGAWAVPK